MDNLDRFSQGRTDSQDKPAAEVGTCSYIFCGQSIFLGDRCYRDDDGDLYCDEYCHARQRGKFIIAGTGELTY